MPVGAAGRVKIVVAQGGDAPDIVVGHGLDGIERGLDPGDPVTAGQVVADLRWAIPGKWEDRETFAPLGPGSKRGMNILHDRPIEAAITQERFGEELMTMMDRCRKELPKEITGRLEAIDYQNCLCEISGYEKVLWGRGRKKQLYPGRG